MPIENQNKRIELAELEKQQFDIEKNLIDTIKEDFEKQDKYNNFLDWLKSKDDDYFKRITLSSGGKVIKFSDYKKPKGVKTINLSDYFDLGRRLIDLSQSERDTLKWILNKSLNPKK